MSENLRLALAHEAIPQEILNIKLGDPIWWILRSYRPSVDILVPCSALGIEEVWRAQDKTVWHRQHVFVNKEEWSSGEYRSLEDFVNKNPDAQLSHVFFGLDELVGYSVPYYEIYLTQQKALQDMVPVRISQKTAQRKLVMWRNRNARFIEESYLNNGIPKPHFPKAFFRPKKVTIIRKIAQNE